MKDETTLPLSSLAPRDPQSHKGDFGRALLVGGSRGMSGAITLAGKATLRSGAGLVTLAVPRTIQDVVAAGEPSYMTVALDDDGDRLSLAAAKQIFELFLRATAVAIGPGLGRSEDLTRLVARFYRESDRPMVVDADGLNALADEQDSLARPGGPRILTPHPGEIARLLKLTDNPSDDKARTALAAELAGCDSSDQTVVILKGHRTVVCDGERFAFNETGNPGMATGGTGDCLTGIICGLLCQGMSAWDAARLGVHVHGLAGDIAAECVGQVSLIASDLIEFLPTAFSSLPSAP